MSSICKSFESNAWRSDLCSHCFQSKEEHGLSTTSSDPCHNGTVVKDVSSNTIGLGSRYQSVLNHSRSSYRTTTTSSTINVASLTTSTAAATTATNQTTSSTVNPVVRSPTLATVVNVVSGVKAILKKNGNRSKTDNGRSKSVNFPAKEEDAQIIGYGGQECFESDDDETDHHYQKSSSDNDEEDDGPFTEEERMIHNQTQKNTSFNSVSRNLLASEVATFKNHGTSSATSRVSTSCTSSSAPLVTIRPFGQSTPSHQTPRTKLNGPSSDCPKINLVSPMRNGQVLTTTTSTSANDVTTSNHQFNNKEEMKNRENLMKKSEHSLTAADVKKPLVVEKITSFSDPVPAAKIPKEINQVDRVKEETTTTTTITTPIAAPVSTNNNSNTKAMVLQSSRVASGRIDSDPAKPASNRITLTRKPPVWREKPRIPIKPQSVTLQPTVEPIPSALHPASQLKKVDTDSVQLAQMKVQKAESQSGQISIRFVHLSSGDDSAKTTGVPPLLPALKTPPAAEKELSALQRLDLLGSAGSKLSTSTPTLSEQSPSFKIPEVSQTVPAKINGEKPSLLVPDVTVPPPRTPSPVIAAPPPTEINNNPIKAVRIEPDKTTLADQPTECARSPQTPKKTSDENLKVDSFSSDGRSSSTRGLTRSAFEALRANLAGTLELSRVCQPQRSSVSNTKRQAPPTPLPRDPEDSPTDAESISTLPPTPVTPSSPVATPVPPIPTPTPSPTPSPPTPPALPALSVAEPDIPAKAISSSLPSSLEVVVRPTPDRAVSASPRFRNSLICTSPEGSLDSTQEEEDYPRSLSLTRVERTDSQSMSTKPPSIRKIIKERATHFLQMAEGGGSCGGGTSSSRLSRSDRFAAESGVTVKKSKGRFSLRKLLGLKKDGGWDEPVEPLPPKIRPEIVHPIDFHPVGQVQVVAGKVDTTNENVIGRSPAHDSISSTDSGRHSSTDLQRSDSSLGSSDCPSPANSHQSSSFKSGSLKGRPKPPPPPRLNSLDQPSSGTPYRSNVSTPTNRPSRPPPPKSAEMANSTDVNRFSPSPVQNNRTNNAGEYANLGDIRNGITPKKPERSASMRTREHSTTYEPLPTEPKQDGLHYDCVSIQQPSSLNKPSADEDGYIIPMRMKSSPSFSSSSSAGSSQRHSLTSFHPPAEGPARRSNRLSSRQSRQDLHVKLEDHYGTVTGANFQALAQLLEQATSKRPLAPHFHELRRVKSQDLKWDVFGDHRLLLRTASLTIVQSSWQKHDLLLSVYNQDLQEMIDNKTPFAQPAVVNFTGHVPATLVQTMGIKAGIEVFPPGQVGTFKQLPHLLAMELEGEMERLQHSLSILLQICRALEWFSQQKRTTNRLNYEEIVFYREHSQDAYRLLWLPQESETGGLSVKETLSSSIRLLSPLLSTLLADKLSFIVTSAGLDKMCQFLEFTMFGPAADLIDGDPDPMDMFQRWLDVERASALNELIRTQGLWRVKLSIIEEFRLSFLISTSPHHLLDTSQI